MKVLDPNPTTLGIFFHLRVLFITCKPDFETACRNMERTKSSQMILSTGSENVNRAMEICYSLPGHTKAIFQRCPRWLGILGRCDKEEG